MTSTQLTTSINARIDTLQHELNAHINAGMHPDSYRIGWLEGAIFELELVRDSVASTEGNAR